jgi:hypothetical protein
MQLHLNQHVTTVQKHRTMALSGFTRPGICEKHVSKTEREGPAETRYGKQTQQSALGTTGKPCNPTPNWLARLALQFSYLSVRWPIKVGLSTANIKQQSIWGIKIQTYQQIRARMGSL